MTGRLPAFAPVRDAWCVGFERSKVCGYGDDLLVRRGFVVPQEFGEQIRNTTPEIALFAFYAICLVLNWWYYLGPKAEFQNP